MEKQKKNNILESLLFNAIIAWYDDSLTEYHGLDDEEFVNRVCEITGLSERDYKNLINGKMEECSWNN